MLMIKLFCLSLALSSSLLADTSEKPNIIFMMTDDQGWGDVAYNGNPIIKTPALDQMAKEGVRLDRFYAAAPVCSPTRGSVMTGRHPYRYNIEWAGEKGLPSAEMTIAETLKSAGYTIYPTLLAAAGIDLPKNQPVLDGVNVLPIWKGNQQKRGSYIHFQAPVMNDKNVFAKKGSLSICVQSEPYKAASFDGGKTWKLYDLSKDRAEKHDLSSKHPKILAHMIAESKSWRQSCKISASGADYK